MAKIETFSEKFDTASLDPARWGTFGDTGNITLSNSQLVIAGSSNSTTYTGCNSLARFDLTDSHITVEVPQVMTGGLGAETQVVLSDTTGDSYSFVCPNGESLGCRIRINGSHDDTFPSWDGPNMRWWRIREQGGTVYWEVSPTGNTWTVIRSATNTITITNLDIGLLVGTWQAIASPTGAVFDNLNVLNTSPTGWFVA